MREHKSHPKELEILLNRKLQAIVKHSYDNVPFYHKLFRELKISPDDIKKADDLHKLPVLEKKDFINIQINERLASNINLNQCQRLTTSGTTGIFLTVYRQKREDLISNLQIYRTQLECGGKITDKQVLLGDPFHIERSPWEKIGIFKKKYISPFEDPKKQIKAIQKFAPQVAIGYPSCVRILAKEVLEMGLQIKIPIIFAGGELLDENTRKLAWQAFGAELFSIYGANEVGKIARECCRHNGLHIWSDRVLIEVIKDGESASAGEEGEICVTNLNQFAMPFLRYNLQDIGSFMEDHCPCGDPFPLIRLTGGRKSDFIWLPNGSTIGATAVYTSLNRIQGIRQFQVIQEKTSSFIVKVVRNNQFTDETTKKIRELICEIVGEVEVYVVEVDAISREKSGKFKPFIPMKACEKAEQFFSRARGD